MDAHKKTKTTHPLNPSPREGKNLSPTPFQWKGAEPLYHTTDPLTWRVLQDRVLEMRKNPTQAEEILWKSLKGNSTGFHFRRQHIIGRFVVDFVCLDRLIVVEVDGDIHDYQKGEDQERTEFLEQNGFKVIRFRNEEVLSGIEAVVLKMIVVWKALPLGKCLG